MNSNAISMNNKAVASLPKHLLQFAVDQRYEDYTPVDHAVWRFIMRQNTFFLREYAHKVYFQGLLDTGISFERIPRISEMNDILGKIDWGAVAVDGFIPPSAFMEFQAYKVLVIACDMRQIHHIEYTPAPDIVHEAAGHAPIIVDREYSNYLQRFGEVGAKAMSSRKDFELYQAIRHLSILKEQPNADQKDLEEATKLVEHRQKNLGERSEMALLSRLHWWTVEYGLIGTLENPKIYGAGLLSSIGESVSCLEPEVKKIPYSIDAMDTAFDITTRQPQLFVCTDFQHLRRVLEEFASKMAYQIGGLEGINKKIEFVSGVEVAGRVENILQRDGKLLLITFSNCSAKYGDRVLFDPTWGMYDMAVGEGISSVFNGAADKDAYNQVALVPKERTIKVPSDATRRRLENLYAQVRKIRESKAGYERLGEIWETQQAEHPDDWLLSMEIFEILDTTDQQPELRAKIEKFLSNKKATSKDFSTLIGWGFRLVEYHKKPEYQAALHASPK